MRLVKVTKLSPTEETLSFSGDYDDLTNKPDLTSLHSHSNKTTLDGVQESLTTALKTNYDTAYTHSQSAHAPSTAQKNSDITKEEIEARLTGEISTHSHAGGGELTKAQILGVGLL